MFQVKGKPILLLCNKSDLDDALDEIHIVDAMDVEAAVNEAKCPTRVEAVAASKNQVYFKQKKVFIFLTLSGTEGGIQTRIVSL